MGLWFASANVPKLNFSKNPTAEQNHNNLNDSFKKMVICHVASFLAQNQILYANHLYT